MFKLHFHSRPENPIISNNNPMLFNPNMHYYVCSSGGCGSTLMCSYLSHFGKVHHIHDRYPPSKLCYVGANNTKDPVYSEWFNNTEIPEELLPNYKVIFMYRHPIDVIFSRFAQPKGPNITHLQHIKCGNNGEIYFGDVVRQRRDLYKLEEFYDNYTLLSKDRNYAICCVKYEDLFSNMPVLNYALELPNIKSLYPIRMERNKTITYATELNSIYRRLIAKMQMMPFVKIIPPLTICDNEEIAFEDDEA